MSDELGSDPGSIANGPIAPSPASALPVEFDGLGHKFQQWKALVRAYWQSRLNRWMKEAIISRWLGSILLFVLVLSIAVCFAVFFAGGVALAGAVARGKDIAPLGAWNALSGFFVVFWLVGLANEAIRGEALSLQRLMHLPISPASVFAFNFLLTWINLPILFFLSSALGLVLGGCVVDGIAGIWKIVPVLSYALMISALTSHLQGKIMVWLANPRTRKTLITVVPILLSFLGVGFAMSSHFIRRLGQGGNTLDWIRIIDATCPLFWLADVLSGKSLLGFGSLIWLPCMWLISAWSLRANYRMTRRYYQNGFDLESSKRSPRRSAEGDGDLPQALSGETLRWMERSFPGLSQPASAIAAMTWTLFWRSPQLKLAMLIPMMQPFFLLLLFNNTSWQKEVPSPPPQPSAVEPASDLQTSPASNLPRSPGFKLPSLALGGGTQQHGFYLLAFTVFSTFLGSSFAGNIFGFDRSGFRFWVLSSLPRSEILRGRNWMFGVMMLVIAVAVIVFTNILLRYSWIRVFEALIAFLAYLPMYLVLSNIISILAPFPMSSQGFQPKEFSWKSVVLSMALSALIPVLMGICCIPWVIELGLQTWVPSTQRVPIALLLLPILVGLSYWLYEQLLVVCGELLQSRETSLLKTVTSQVEK